MSHEVGKKHALNGFLCSLHLYESMQLILLIGTSDYPLRAVKLPYIIPFEARHVRTCSNPGVPSHPLCGSTIKIPLLLL